MEFAHSIQKIPNAFSPYPLSREQLAEFYYDGTMPVRTGDLYDSPIQDIIDECVTPTESGNAFLLLGHKGCGKSTELNKMSEDLEGPDGTGTPVHTILCGTDLDLRSPVYSDLLILMGEALLEIAQKRGVHVGERIEDTIRSFFTRETEREGTAGRETDASVEAGVSAGRSVAGLLRLIGGAKASIKYGETDRTTYRETIQKRLSVWLDAMDTIADRIAAASEGRRPVIIFEDLDKLDQKEAWEVFLHHSQKLAGVSFPVIYTFPIALAYAPEFHSLEGVFTAKFFPMIRLKKQDGSDDPAGLSTIREIVEKRADPELFDQKALDDLIRRTGGSLRDLFNAINACSRRALRRRSERIEQEDADRALEQLKSSLTKRIEQKYYPFLEMIRGGQHTDIPDQKKLLEMLQAGVVLEYDNHGDWRDVHPLVAEYLEDLRTKGLIGEDEGHGDGEEREDS